jgi:hypothetical protein
VLRCLVTDVQNKKPRPEPGGWAGARASISRTALLTLSPSW